MGDPGHPEAGHRDQCLVLGAGRVPRPAGRRGLGVGGVGVGGVAGELAGRDGQLDGDLSGGAGVDEVHQGVGSGGLEAGASALGDVAAGQPVDDRPGGSGLLDGQGGAPLVDPGGPGGAAQRPLAPGTFGQGGAPARDRRVPARAGCAAAAVRRPRRRRWSGAGRPRRCRPGDTPRGRPRPARRPRRRRGRRRGDRQPSVDQLRWRVIRSTAVATRSVAAAALRPRRSSTSAGASRRWWPRPRNCSTTVPSSSATSSRAAMWANATVCSAATVEDLLAAADQVHPVLGARRSTRWPGRRTAAPAAETGSPRVRTCVQSRRSRHLRASRWRRIPFSSNTFRCTGGWLRLSVACASRARRGRRSRGRAWPTARRRACRR